MPSKLPRFNICLDALDRQMLEQLSDHSHVPSSIVLRTLIRASFNHNTGRDSLCADCTACQRSPSDQKDRRAAAARRWKALARPDLAPGTKEPEQ
jgi:hypothetical protein